MIGTTNYEDTRELKVVKTYLGDEPKADPNTGATGTDMVMEPKTREKDKGKMSEGKDVDKTTTQPVENIWETNKRQRREKEPHAEPVKEATHA
ncbi:uncharacterized protein LOC141621364 isoform X2 [Silene latifolia]